MSAIPKTLPAFIWHFIKPYRGNILWLMATGLFWATQLSVTPYVMKILIDTVNEYPSDATGFIAAVTGPAVLYVSLTLLQVIIYRFYDYLTLRTIPFIKADIIVAMFGYLEEHSYSYFQHNFSGSLANKIADMEKNVGNILSSLIDLFFSHFFAVVFAAIMMYIVNPAFSYVLIGWSVLFLGGTVYLSKQSHRYSEIFSHARSTLMGTIVDSLSNIINIKIFSSTRFEQKYLRTFTKEMIQKDQKMQMYLLYVKAFQGATVVILIALMVALLVYKRSQNQVTIGDFAFILTLSMSLIEALWHLAQELVKFSEDTGTCSQALSMITAPHEIKDMPDAKELQLSKGEIVFDNVTFKYVKGRNIFRNKKITIKAGEKIGLIGFSGCGKTTFIHLIMRFFDLEAGRILIDGQDIAHITQESLRKNIAMIPQDPQLFHRSLMENIRYGKMDATDEEVIESSKKAHCHEFIQHLKEGYNTLAGERGIKLSGGQRQRVAIARAILKNAPILILDEATSALDSVTEKYIQESLEQLMKNRTTIVIAHRLSTLSYMDRIIVFKDGQIIEEGTHEKLLKHHGHYAKLWNMQVRGFMLDNV